MVGNPFKTELKRKIIDDFFRILYFSIFFPSPGNLSSVILLFYKESFYNVYRIVHFAVEKEFKKLNKDERIFFFRLI